ncbi:MAG: hypothetical protein ABSE48_08080 [Verrucomicrobiota bacterium]|jgi:hypothetical protein
MKTRMTPGLQGTNLQELLKVEGLRKSSPAAALAVRDFANPRKAKEFGKILRESKFNYSVTINQIENREV